MHHNLPMEMTRPVFPSFNKKTKHFSSLGKQKAMYAHAVVNYAPIRMENEMPASEPLSDLNLTLVPSFSYYRRKFAFSQVEDCLQGVSNTVWIVNKQGIFQYDIAFIAVVSGDDLNSYLQVVVRASSEHDGSQHSRLVLGVNIAVNE